MINLEQFSVALLRDIANEQTNYAKLFAQKQSNKVFNQDLTKALEISLTLISAIKETTKGGRWPDAVEARNNTEEEHYISIDFAMPIALNKEFTDSEGFRHRAHIAYPKGSGMSSYVIVSNTKAIPLLVNYYQS